LQQLGQGPGIEHAICRPGDMVGDGQLDSFLAAGEPLQPFLDNFLGFLS